MAGASKPKNWDEVCKRNAGRRKLHMRKRQERANRMVGLLRVFDDARELQDSSYGWLSLAAEEMGRSVATASRDFALCRRMRGQFVRMFGREIDPAQDHVMWSWDYSNYGFFTRETAIAGHRKPVGRFPFSTRGTVGEEAYCGFTPLSWRTPQEKCREDYGQSLVSLARAIGRL